MIKFDVKYAILKYESHSKCRRPRNFEDYKERIAEIEKQQKKLFRYIPWPDIYMWYDSDVEYQVEIDRLKSFWYEEYLKDFSYRYDQSKLWEDEDDWYWTTRCYIF